MTFVLFRSKTPRMTEGPEGTRNDPGPWKRFIDTVRDVCTYETEKGADQS